jgi:hypothetical protein
MLGAESGGQRDIPALRQSIERMAQIRRDRGGMRHQRHTLALQRRAQGRVGQQPVDTEENVSHGCCAAPSGRMKQEGEWKSGLPSGWARAQ